MGWHVATRGAWALISVVDLQHRTLLLLVSCHKLLGCMCWLHAHSMYTVAGPAAIDCSLRAELTAC